MVENNFSIHGVKLTIHAIGINMLSKFSDISSKVIGY